MGLQSTILDHLLLSLFRDSKMEMSTIFSHGNSFQIFLNLMSCSLLLEIHNKVLLTSIWTALKSVFLPFLISSNIVANRRNQMLKCDAKNSIDKIIVFNFAVHFRIIPLSLSSSSKPLSCCMCRDPKTNINAEGGWLPPHGWTVWS
jgi:hypothetical protein